jgi:hypothetical protein
MERRRPVPQVLKIPGGSPALDIEMRFIKLDLDRELLINLLDVRRLVEEASETLRETWNRQTKFVRTVFLDAEVLGIPVELMPATIWPNGEIDLVVMGSPSGLTEALLPDIKFDAQVTYYLRVGEPQRVRTVVPSGILARIRLGGRDNPDYTRHVDAIMSYNKLAGDSRLK